MRPLFTRQPRPGIPVAGVLVLTLAISLPSAIPARCQVAGPSDTLFSPGDPSVGSGLVERTAELAEEGIDLEPLSEEIAAGSRVDLNRAGAADLDAIPFLDAVKRKNLIDYVATYGEVLSHYELLAIPGFDSSLVKQILPYLKFVRRSGVPPATVGNLLRYGRHALSVSTGIHLPLSEEYGADTVTDSSTLYPGSPVRLSFRYTWSWYGKAEIGLAGEKDPGEQFFRGNQRNGMDFYAGHLTLKELGWLKNLTVGHFRVTFGQGLTIGTGRGMGSVPGFRQGSTQPPGIRSSLGMSEGSYLRGAAVTVKAGPFDISAFASRHPRDGTVTGRDSTTSKVLAVSSFLETGYHRTASELAKREVVTETLIGGNLTWRFTSGRSFAGRVGMTALYSRYSARVIPASSEANRFAFRGDRNLGTGVEWRLRLFGWYLFGEAARSRNGGTAILAGVSVSPAYGSGVTVIVRNYSNPYQDLYSGAFGQGSKNSGERGIFVSVAAGVSPALSLEGFADLFYFTCPRYRLDRPGHGMESGISATWKPASQVEISFRFHMKSSPANVPSAGTEKLRRQGDSRSNGWRIGLSWSPIPGLQLRSRVEMKRSGAVSWSGPAGYLAYQEIFSPVGKGRCAFTVRMSLFDIPSNDLRIYSWEPGVPNSLTVQASEGRGSEFLLLIRVRLIKQADLWFRAAVTRCSGRRGMTTGTVREAGNLQTELTGQLMIRL